MSQSLKVTPFWNIQMGEVHVAMLDLRIHFLLCLLPMPFLSLARAQLI